MTSIVISLLLNLAIFTTGTTPENQKDKNSKDSAETTQTTPPTTSTFGGTGTWVDKR